MTRARDRAEVGLSSAQKQAKTQTKRLLETEDQLRIVKKQIVDLKKKLVEAEEAKNVAKWARDEALRAKTEAEFAKTEAEFAKTEAETSKDKAEEEAYDARVADTQAILKAQIPGVCQLYCSQVWNEALKQAGVEALSDLWKMEKVYYPPAIRETNSETASAPEEAEVAQPEAALTVSPTNEPAEGGELLKVTKTSGSSNPEAP